MKIRSHILVGATLVVAAFVLTACETTVTTPPPSPKPRPQMCPKIYQPVCGERGTQRQTFPNACTANASGYKVVAQGQCTAAEPYTYKNRYN